jgi:hypothetical protein
MMRTIRLSVALTAIAVLPAGAHAEEAAKPPEPPSGRTFFVRQTVGSDSNDGLSPDTAWMSISKLSDALQAGDTAYVGPGLYRDEILIGRDGTLVNPITLVGDASGTYTTDPPGTVMIAGSDPVDESIFTATSSPGVYKAEMGEHPIGGVVEMDGPQFRYFRAESTKEHIVEKLSEVDVVAKLPSTFFYDEAAKVVYIHTSDSKSPKTHEIEVMHRSDGIAVVGRHFVTVTGFTIRHTADSGIRFWEGAGDGIAVHNTAYGCRQGVRVYGATKILVSGNTLFRNENSGVYFAKVSTDGHAVGNTFYENVKGVRWSTESANGLASGNVSFDNIEAGVSVENAENVRIVDNRLVGNKRAQILAIGTRPLADGNCLESGASGKSIAEYTYTGYDGLPAYQKAAMRDHGSRQGDCGPLPAKIDVHALHDQTTRYAEEARKLLAARKDQPAKASAH